LFAVNLFAFGELLPRAAIMIRRLQAAKQSVDDSPKALEIAPRSSYVPALPIGA
jgi:hypothetical protein